jgi:hypothetical protein
MRRTLPERRLAAKKESWRKRMPVQICQKSKLAAAWEEKAPLSLR